MIMATFGARKRLADPLPRLAKSGIGGTDCRLADGGRLRHGANQ